MKKKTFFLSSLVAVALFVAAISFVSCNKDDVDYDSMNTPTYVVTPDSPKSNESYHCPWCNRLCGPHETYTMCEHHYGAYQNSNRGWGGIAHPDSVYCKDPDCPLYIASTDPTSPSYNPAHDPCNSAYDPTVAPLPIKHFHVFDVCSWGHAEHFHVGGGSNSYSHHSNNTH